MFILSEEKILVQLFDSVSEHEQRNEYIEEKYKYFDKNGKELALKSLIIDVASGREKEVYLDFVVNEITYSRGRIYPHNEFDYISENITNVAYIYRIENQKLLTTDQKCVSISGEDASISFEIAPEYSTLPYPVANDRYCYISDSGDYYLINADGDVIAKIKSTNTIVKYNDKYIATDDKIYDYNIKLVYDLEENKKELVELMANGFIVKDSEFTEGEYHLHTKDGKIIKIENYYDSSSQYYITREAMGYDNNFMYHTYKYCFYNDNGDEIATKDYVYEAPRVIYTAEDNEYIIIALDYKFKTYYYKCYYEYPYKLS